MNLPPARESTVPATPQDGADSSEVAVSETIARVVAGPELVHAFLIILGTIAFLYFTRNIVMPIVLACGAAMTLKPLMRWAGFCHIRPPLAAVILLSVLVTCVIVGFMQLGRPAMTYLNNAPEHMTQLRQRIQKIFPGGTRITEAAAAVSNLGATEAEKKAAQIAAPTVKVKDDHGTSSVVNWTGTFLAGACETLILLYLLLASGDLFLQKLVHVMPTLSDKKRAVEISHEIQQNISNYLLTVSLINLCLGTAVGLGLYFLNIPNAAMWGMLAAILNFIPFFGPLAGVALLAAVGILTFDSLWQGLLPPVWYLVLHLLEANLITPVLLGRRFTLNPVVIFVSLMFWTWLWGVPGALLSLPILVSIKVISDRVPKMSSVSELLTK